MKVSANITPSYLKSVIFYDHDRGKFFWRERSASMFSDGLQSASHNCAIFNGLYAGREACCYRRTNGYLVTNVSGKILRAHRIGWAIYYGEFPDGDIDHINRDRSDNRIVNLRCVTRSVNLQNQGLSSRNKSGVLGVSWCKNRNKWTARIAHNGKYLNLGYFLEMEDARAARIRAEVKLWNKRDILRAQGIVIREV